MPWNWQKDLEHGTHVTWNFVGVPEEGAKPVIRPELISRDTIQRVHVVTGIVPVLFDPENVDIGVRPLESIAEEIYKKLSEAKADLQDSHI